MRFVFLLVLLSTLVACSNSEPFSPTASPIIESVSIEAGSTFESSLNGFSFANFPGGQGATEVSAEDLADMFGRDGVCSSKANQECVPYPGVAIFLERLNGVLANGLCYGMSATAMNYFGGAIALGGSANEGSHLIDIQRSNAVEGSIAKHHIMQFSEEYRDSLDQFLEMEPIHIAKELWQVFSNLGTSIPPYALALYTEDGGHSVTPIRIEESTDRFNIFVYDSNWPKETRWVEINRADNSWSYQATSKDKHSDKDMWTGVGAGSMSLIPHTLPNETFECFFCQSANETDLSKSSGSVLMLESVDISNTAITVRLDNGNEVHWSTRYQSETSEVKFYLLPSQSSPGDTPAGAVMFFIPSVVGGFEIELAQIQKTEDPQVFSAILIGSEMPTTEIRGKAQGDQSRTILDVSTQVTEGDFTVVVEGSLVERVRGANYESSASVELLDGEMYKIQTSARNLEDIEVLEVATGEQIVSLKTIMRAVDTPLRRLESGDGMSFSRRIAETGERSVRIESSDHDWISATEAFEYEVAFSDGSSASFGRDPSRSMVGVFSDGSISIRDESGSGIHVTHDGWVIDEPRKGEYEVFRRSEEGIFEAPSIEDLSELQFSSQETRETIKEIIGRSSPIPVEGLSKSESSDNRGIPSGDLEVTGGPPEALSGRYGLIHRIKEEFGERRPEGVNSEEALKDVPRTVPGRIISSAEIARPDGPTPEARREAAPVPTPTKPSRNEPTPEARREAAPVLTPTKPSRNEPSPEARREAAPVPTPTKPSRNEPTPEAEAPTLTPDRGSASRR
jgi:hypothetical protein